MKKITLLILFLSTTACQVAPPFYTKDFGLGGYKDEKISQDSYKITYYKSTRMSPSDAGLLIEHRAAQIATQKGFQYMRIVSRGYEQMPRFVTQHQGMYFVVLFYNQRKDYNDKVVAQVLQQNYPSKIMTDYTLRNTENFIRNNVRYRRY